LAKSLKRLTRIPGQTDVRLNSSIRQPASDPRSQTAEPQNNRCDVAASCPHSIFAKRLECCADRSSPPPRPVIRALANIVIGGWSRRNRKLVPTIWSYGAPEWIELPEITVLEILLIPFRGSFPACERYQQHCWMTNRTT